MIENILLRQKHLNFLLSKFPLQKVVASPSIHGGAECYTILFLHEVVEQMKVSNKINKKILALMEGKEKEIAKKS